MGHDKRRLSLGGETLLQRNLAFLRGIFPVVALSVRDAEQAPDGPPAGGGGRPRRRHRLAAGRDRLRAHAVRRAVLRPRHRRGVPAGRRGRARAARVPGVDVATPVVGDHWEPLHAVYGPAACRTSSRCSPPARTASSTSSRWCAVRRIPFDDPAPFFNVNTPGDWAEARRLAGEAPDEAAAARRRRLRAARARRRRPLGERQDDAHRAAHPRAHAPRPAAWPRSSAWRASTSTRRARTRGATARPGRRPTPSPRPRSSPSSPSSPASPASQTIVARYFDGYDVVVCEGYRHETPWVVEVFRPGEGRDAPLLEARVTLALVTRRGPAPPAPLRAGRRAGARRLRRAAAGPSGLLTA